MKNTSICNLKVGNITNSRKYKVSPTLHTLTLLLPFKYLKVQSEPKIAQTFQQCFSNRYYIRTPLRNFSKKPSVICFAVIYTKKIRENQTQVTVVLETL
jgi:hypothetical protein